MKLSTMVEETLTTEEIEVIEEKKKCKKKKAIVPMMEEGMVKCDTEGCDAEYEQSLPTCPKCGEANKNVPVDESTTENEEAVKIAIEETNYLADLAGIHYTPAPAPTIAEEVEVKTDETPVVEEVETETEVETEVVTESNDGLLETPATADETTELEWLKSLASN